MAVEDWGGMCMQVHLPPSLTSHIQSTGWGSSLVKPSCGQWRRLGVLLWFRKIKVFAGGRNKGAPRSALENVARAQLTNTVPGIHRFFSFLGSGGDVDLATIISLAARVDGEPDLRWMMIWVAAHRPLFAREMVTGYEYERCCIQTGIGDWWSRFTWLWFKASFFVLFNFEPLDYLLLEIRISRVLEPRSPV